MQTDHRVVKRIELADTGSGMLLVLYRPKPVRRVLINPENSSNALKNRLQQSDIDCRKMELSKLAAHHGGKLSINFLSIKERVLK